MENINNWNLRKMFPTDNDWYDRLNYIKNIVDDLCSRKGNCATSAEELLKTVKQYFEIDEKLYELEVFANSNFDQDMSDKTAKLLYEVCQNESTLIGEKLSFLAPELMQYDMETFNKYKQECKELEEYEFWFKNFFDKKKHILSNDLETLLVRLNDMGESFSKVYEDLTVNDFEYEDIKNDKGEIVKADEANYQIALQSYDRSFRERYYKSLLTTYGKHKDTLTSIYYGSVKNDVFTAKTRKYENARAMSLFANHIPEEVYDNLLKTVEENTKPLHDYVKYRKEKMNIDNVHFYDLFVPLVKESAKTYSYEEAKDLVLKATAILGEDYTALVQRAFDERWIDVYPKPNKRPGAYSTGSYKSYPYILLNYTGTLDDVFTLAHEVGHSIHTHYSCQNQPYQYSSYSIFCAEVASTLNEQLLSKYLYDNATDDNEKAILLDKKINDIRSTFYRQTMFASFENQTHKWVESGEPLISTKLCDLHADLNKLYYGEDFVVDTELSYEWSRIPHFYSAFYVYQYATGISASIAIAKNIFENGQKAIDDYKQFLKGGSSRNPIDMLKVAGVDMASKDAILATTEDFANTLKLLKELN